MFRTFIFDSNNKLLVKGDITIDDGTSNYIVLQSDSNDLNSLRVNGNTKVTSNVYVLNRLGVGTSNPSERVDIIDNVKTSSNLYVMNWVGAGTSNPTERLDVVGNNKVRSNLYVLSNLSISHSNPTEKLDVSGNVKISSNLYIFNRVGVNTSNPVVGLEVNTTDAVLVSKGTTAQRPSIPVLGHVRYNTDNSQFEGFGAGNAWGSLGGVKSTNQQTYVSAEEYPTSNDDNIRFFNSNIESMRITRQRLVGINTSNPSERLDIVGNVKMSSNLYIFNKVGINTSNPAVGLEVNTTDAVLVSKGTTAQRPSVPVLGHVRYNTDNSQFEGFGAGNAWGSLGGVKSTNQQTYVSAEEYPTSNDDNIRFFNSNIESMRITRQRLVGINTSNPSERVDIVGNTKVSSNLYVFNRVGINTSNPAVGLEVNTTDAVLVSKGTTAQRPSVPVLGHVRYNTDNSQFEGFGAGNAWGSLGGVKSTNQQTYVSAEEYPTSNDDNIRFFNSNIESMRITRERLVGINTSNPSERLDVVGNVKVSSNEYVMGSVGIGTSNPTYKLDVVGEARVQSNLYIGMDNNSSSGTYTSGKILFGGTFGDLGYNHAQIAVRRYAGTGESSEMVIAKFNDVGTDGPDRIRLRAAALAFDTYSSFQLPSNLDGDFTASNIRMYITETGNVGVGTTTPQAPLEVVGNTITTTVSTSNVSTSNLSSSNIRTCNLNVNSIVASNIITSNLVIVNSNISTNTVTALETITSSNIFTSNLYTSRRIGAGTSNPQYTLEVQGDVFVTGPAILSNSLNATGPMTLCNTLNVAGSVLLSNTLLTYGATTLSNTVNISGATTLSNTLNVSGATLLSNALTTYNGPSTFSNNVIVTGQTSLSNTLNVAGAVSFSNNLTVAGNSFLSNDVTVIGRTTLCNLANLFGATTLSNTLTVSGATLLSNTLTTYNGTTTHSNAVTVSGVTTLCNNLNVSGPMTLCNTMNVSGAALLSNTLITYGAATLSNTLNISGATTLSNTLNVSGATTLSNTLVTYNGTTTHSNAVNVSGITTLCNNLNVSGPMTLCNTMNVSGATLLSNTLLTYGATTLSNTVNISGATTLSNTLNVSGATLLSNVLTTYNGTTTHSNAVTVSGVTTLCNNLNVSGPMTLCNTMNVAGATLLSNNLTVYGATTMSNTVTISGATTLSNTLNVSGATILSNALTTYNVTTTHSNDVIVSGITTLSNNLNVSGPMTLCNTMNVAGAALLSNTLTTYGATTLSNTVSISGATTLSNTLNVSGATVLSNTLTTYNGTTTHSNAMIVYGTTTLSNNLNLSGPMSLCNTLNVSGATLLSNTLITYGATTLSNTVNISGATTLSNNLNVSGATLLSNALTTYNGPSTFSNAVNVSGITTLSNNLNVSGPMTLCNSLNVSGASLFSNTMTTYGATTLSNTVNISGATTLSNTLNVSGATLLSNALTTYNGPSTFSNAVNVSGVTTLCNNLNVSGPMTLCNTMNVSGATTLSNTLTTYGVTTLSNSLSVGGATTLSNTLLTYGVTTLSNNVNVFGPVSLSNTFTTTGATTLSNTLLTYGATTLSNTVLVAGATTLSNTLVTYNGATTHSNAVNVSGVTTLCNNLNVSGPMTLCNTMNMSGAALLSNTLTVYGATTLSNTLGVSGATSLSNTLNVSGATVLSNGITVYNGTSTLSNNTYISGNVGIGTSSTNAKLDVRGAIYIDGVAGQYPASGFASKKEYIRFGTTDGVNDYARIYGEGTTNSGKLVIAIQDDMDSSEALIVRGERGDGSTRDNMTIRNDGLVGIGTGMTITEKLQVASGKIYSDTQLLGTSNDTASVPSFSFKEDSNTGIFYASNDALGFTTNGSEKMRIDTNGNVGIGTTTPSEKLEVIGTAKITSNAYIMSKVGIGTSNISTACNFLLHVAGDARVDGNLDVTGIFSVTNTDVKLTDQFTVSNNGTGPALNVYQMGANPIADFYDDATLALRIADGGSVGIKTGTPTETLDVNGTMKVRSNVYLMSQLGVGTSNPFYTLDVSGTQRTTGATMLSNTLLVYGASTFSNNTTTSGVATISNNLNVSGSTILGGSSKIAIQGGVDGGSNFGIFTWAGNDTNWGIYTGQSGAGKSLAGGIAVSGGGFTSYATRIRVADNSNTGFVLENHNEELLMSVRGSDGFTYFSSNVGIGTSSFGERLQVSGKIHSDTQVLGTSNDLVSRPSFSFREDSNTGIYHPAGASTIAITTGGTERVRVDSSGNVGIATTSANERLQVSGKIHSDTQVLSTSNDSVSAPAFSFKENSNTGLFHAGTDTIGVSTGGTERVRVDNVGNVGIGVVPINTLDVNGKVLIRNGNSANNYNSNQIGFGWNNTSNFQHSLRTRHNSAADNTNNAIDFYVWQTSQLQSDVGNKQVLSITSPGVGIFNSNPAFSLDVTGTINSTGNITGPTITSLTNQASFGSNTAVSASNTTISLSNYVYGTNTTNITAAQTTANWASNAGLFGSNTAVWSSNNLLNKAGGTISGNLVVSSNLGIGTSNPQTNLHLVNPAGGDMLTLESSTTNSRSTIKFLTGTNTGWELGTRGTAGTPNNAFYLYNNTVGGTNVSQYRLVVDETGNLGIGTTTPAFKVDVVGTINSSGNITGPTITSLSNLGVFGSNTSISASNTVISLSNYVYGTNTTNITNAQTTANWASNAGLFGSNTAVWSSNNLYNKAGGTISGNVVVTGTTALSNLVTLFATSGGGAATMVMNSTSGSGGRDYRIISTLSGNAGGTGAFQIYDQTAPATRLHIDSNGNVGIGTTAPAFRLDVSGTLNSSGNLTGPTITSLSNLGIFGSNTSISASNTVISLSNYVYGTNTTNITAAQTTANWASNAGLFGSNTSVSASNTVISLSNYVYGTNTTSIITAQTTANWASNAGLFGSNTAVWSSNNLLNRNTGGTVSSSLTLSSNLTVSGNVANTFDTTIGSMLIKTYNKSLGTTALNFTNICILTMNNGAATVHLDIVHSEINSSESKSYIFPIQWMNTTTSYYTLLPISSSGIYNTNDWSVEINPSAGVNTLRLVRLSGTTSTVNYTCTLRVYQSSVNSVSIADSTTTGTGATNIGIYESTPLTQVDGNVGIGLSNPTSKLDVSGTINSTGIITGPTITSLSNLGIFSSNTAISASNTTISLSNYVYGTNTTNITNAQTTANWASNAGFFGSNTAVSASNIVISLSNYTYGTNTTNITNAQTTANWASNAGLFGSNTAVWSSNNLLNVNTGGTINGNVTVFGAFTVSNASLTCSNLLVRRDGDDALSFDVYEGFSLIRNTQVEDDLQVGGACNLLLRTYTGSAWATRMYIQNNGNIGIGTTTPATTLDILGDVKITSTNAAHLTLSNNNSPYLLIHGSNGRAALGVATVAGQQSTDAAAGDIVLKNFGLTTGRVLIQSQNSGSAICVNSNNTVGLGTASPLANLHINNDFHIAANSGAWNSNAGKGVFIRYSTAGSQDAAYIQSISRSTTTLQSMVIEARNLQIGPTTGNSTPSFTIQTTNNIGVGVSNPTEKLHVASGKLYSDTQVLGTSNDSVTTPSFSFKEDSNTGLYHPTSIATLGFVTAGTERMRIDSSGNVGIGLSNPTYTLDVTGDINFTGTFRKGGIPYIGSQWSNNSSNVFLLGSNVGIGTQTPLNALDIVGNQSTTGYLLSALSNTNISTALAAFPDTTLGFGRLTASSSTTTAGLGRISWFGFNRNTPSASISVDTNGGWDDTGHIRFATSTGGGGNLSTKMTLTHTGLLGIGTSNPTFTLDVSGNARLTSALSLSGGANSVQITNGDPGDMIFKQYTVAGDRYGMGHYTGAITRMFAASTTSTSIRLSAPTNDSRTGSGATFTDYLTVLAGTNANAGNVGIGTTSPAVPLHVYRASSVNALLESSTAKTQLWAHSDGKSYIQSSNDLFFGQINNTSAPRMYLTSGANLGINTISPSERLHVASGKIYSDTQILGNSNDSLAVPSFSFREDSNTGMYHPCNDVIGFTVGGVEAFRVAPDAVTMTSNLNVGSDIVANGNLTMNNRLVVSTLKINRKTGVDVNVTSTSIRGFSNDGAGFILDVGSNAPASNRSLRITYSNATELMRIRGDGNVGIGTTNPQYKLDVNGDVNIGSSSANFALTSTGQFTIWANRTGAPTFWHMSYCVGSNNSTNGDHIWYTRGNAASGTERMRILSGGNVGIGTGSPAFSLQVSSNTSGGAAIALDNPNTAGWTHICARNTASVTNGGMRMGMIGTTWTGSGQYLQNGGFLDCDQSNGISICASSNTGSVRFYAGGTTEIMRVNSNANIGIGLTNPTYKLDVLGDVKITNPNNALHMNLSNNNSPYLQIHGSNGIISLGVASSATVHSTDAVAGDAVLKNMGVSTGKLLLQVQSGASAICINSNNNVGIGTTTPGYKFEVNGDVRIPNNFALMSGTSTGFLRMLGVANATFIQSGLNANTNSAAPLCFGTIGNATEWARFDNTGNFGIGTTSPIEKLTLSNGNIRIETTSGGNAYVNFVESGFNDRFGILTTFGGTGNQNTFNITSSTLGSNPVAPDAKITMLMDGSVGIGTTSPSYKLDIAGDTRISGMALLSGGSNCVQITNGDPGDMIVKSYGTGDRYGVGQYAGAITRLFAASVANTSIRLSAPTDNVRTSSAGFTDYLTVLSGTNANAGFVGIGITSPSSRLHVSGDILATGNVTAYSDARAKSNLEIISAPLDKISKLNGYTYDMIDEPDLTTKITKRFTGIIAQELEKVLPEAVHQDPTGKYSVAYGNLAGLFIEAIKELTTENNELKQKIFTLEERLSIIEQTLTNSV